MAQQIDNRGPAARKVELEKRLDANAETGRRAFARTGGSKPSKQPPRRSAPAGRH